MWTYRRKAPSAKALIETFGVTDQEAEFIRQCLQDGNMKKINLPGFYGVEHAFTESGGVGFSYLNTGDTYSPTIVRRNGSDTYRISTMGDEVEAMERKGVKFQ